MSEGQRTFLFVWEGHWKMLELPRTANTNEGC